VREYAFFCASASVVATRLPTARPQLLRGVRTRGNAANLLRAAPRARRFAAVAAGAAAVGTGARDAPAAGIVSAAVGAYTPVPDLVRAGPEKVHSRAGRTGPLPAIEDPMRMIQAILAPERLTAVTALLAEAEIFRMTVSEVHGVSNMHGVALSEVSPEPMVRIEVGVNESFVDAAVGAIEQGGGDRGRIFMWELHDVIRIRTGETGPAAI